MLRNTLTTWGSAAKTLHWGLALLVILQIALGLLAISWYRSPAKIELFVWHKSIGMLILALMLLRVLWRCVNPTPLLPATMPRLERHLAGASHLLLYLSLLALPLSGWVVSSASNIPFRLFWLWPLPAIVAPDKALEHAAETVHLTAVVVLCALLVLHIGAALRHHFVLRDNILRRMLPGNAARQ